MKYTNRSSEGEGSIQSACVHWLVKAFVDQVSEIKKKRTFTSKSKHVADISKLVNQILIGSDWLACVFDALVLIPLMTHRLKIIRPHTLIRDNKRPMTLTGW